MTAKMFCVGGVKLSCDSTVEETLATDTSFVVQPLRTDTDIEEKRQNAIEQVGIFSLLVTPDWCFGTSDKLVCSFIVYPKRRTGGGVYLNLRRLDLWSNSLLCSATEVKLRLSPLDLNCCCRQSAHELNEFGHIDRSHVLSSLYSFSQKKPLFPPHGQVQPISNHYSCSQGKVCIKSLSGNSCVYGVSGYTV